MMLPQLNKKETGVSSSKVPVMSQHLTRARGGKEQRALLPPHPAVMKLLLLLLLLLLSTPLQGHHKATYMQRR